ncbi:MAG TPA: cell envelope integrity protein TolA [Sphingomonas sp.]
MDRAERNGFAIALAGHVLLFGALSLGLLTARIPKPPVAETMDVTFTDKAALASAAPKAATEAPAPSEAPDKGAPEESAPPPPEPEPAPPKPEKPEPKKPEPQKPQPKPKPEPKPEPNPAPKPEPKPEKPQPRPKPEKPKPAPAKPEKSKPEKASPQKPAPDESASKPSRAKPTTAKHAAGLPSDFLSDLPGDKPGKGKAEKAKGSRLGKDFLKGLSADKSEGKSSAPRASAVSALALNGIGAMIKQQVRPNYNPPSGGTDSASIVTTLNITMARDGSVSSVEVVGHRGVNGSNSGYVKQADDAAIRAVRRSSPLKLPPDLYDGGWENITLNFSPAQMQ